MPATVAFTSGTTLTPLKTTTVGNTSTGTGSAGNVPQLVNINPLDFTGGTAQGMTAVPDELYQFINLLANGDNVNSVTGWGLDWWSTAVLVAKMYQAIVQKGAPSSYSPV